MHVGEARERLPGSAMPTHQEIREFAQRLSESTNYRFKDQSPESRVALLSKK